MLVSFLWTTRTTSCTLKSEVKYKRFEYEEVKFNAQAWLGQGFSPASSRMVYVMTQNLLTRRYLLWRSSSKHAIISLWLPLKNLRSRTGPPARRTVIARSLPDPQSRALVSTRPRSGLTRSQRLTRTMASADWTARKVRRGTVTHVVSALPLADASGRCCELTPVAARLSLCAIRALQWPA